MPCLIQIPWWGRIGIDALILLSLVMNWNNHSWRGERELQFSRGHWYWLGGTLPGFTASKNKNADDVDNKKVEIKLMGEFFITPWLIVLRFKLVDSAAVLSGSSINNLTHKLFRRLFAGDRLALVLLRDSAETEDLRRLRVLLKFGLAAGTH